jgi:hypothetical protein
MGRAILTGGLAHPLAHPERREADRRPPGDGEPLGRIRLRTGREVTVIDVSDSGVLVEGTTRLLPGTHVDAHVITMAGRLLVRSRVIRAWVSALDKDGVRYRTALGFQQRVDTSDPGYGVPDPASGQAPQAGTPYPDKSAEASSIEQEMSPA